MSDVDEASGEEYVVEAILKHRRNGAEIQYLIKWEGYPMDEVTWESEDNLTGCPKLLAEYKREHMAKGRKRKSEDPVTSSDGGGASTSKAKKESRVQSESSSASTYVSRPPSVRQSDVSPTPAKVVHFEGDAPEDEDINKLPDVMPERRSSSPTPEAENSGDSDARKTGTPFDNGAVAKKVLGVTRYPDGTLWILVSWTDPNLVAELIPNYVANEKIPELMIAYYEKHLQWKEYGGRKSEAKAQQQQQQ